jgi:hypothetical protein
VARRARACRRRPPPASPRRRSRTITRQVRAPLCCLHASLLTRLSPLLCSREPRVPAVGRLPHFPRRGRAHLEVRDRALLCMSDSLTFDRTVPPANRMPPIRSGRFSLFGTSRCSSSLSSCSRRRTLVCSRGCTSHHTAGHGTPPRPSRSSSSLRSWRASCVCAVCRLRPPSSPASSHVLSSLRPVQPHTDDWRHPPLALRPRGDSHGHFARPLPPTHRVQRAMYCGRGPAHFRDLRRRADRVRGRPPRAHVGARAARRKAAGPARAPPRRPRPRRHVDVPRRLLCAALSLSPSALR